MISGSPPHTNREGPRDVDEVVSKELHWPTLAPIDTRLAELKARHGATDELFTDILDLVRDVKNGDPSCQGSVPKDIRTFNSKLKGTESLQPTVHWACPVCKKKFSAEFPSSLKDLKCHTQALHTHPHFFSISLRNLLAIRLPEVFPLVKNETLTYEQYTRVKQFVLFRDEEDIFIAANTDGVAIAKCGSGSVWPVLLTILGTPEHTKSGYRNMLLKALWIGKEQPDVNWIMEVLVQELKDIEQQPIKWSLNGRTFKTRAYLAFVATDSPARIKVSGLPGISGEHGCTFCLHE
jgi:hypothetical protein